jgi:TM2 domain-containing membrane protein YozV
VIEPGLSGLIFVWAKRCRNIAQFRLKVHIVEYFLVKEEDKRMALSTQEQMLVEQRVTNEAKSAGVAYLLLIFFGGFGAHRFYLGSTGSAIAMLIMSILGWLTVAIGVGLFLLAAVGIWLIVDLFLIPGIIQQHKDQVRQRLSMQMGSASSLPA